MLKLKKCTLITYINHLKWYRVTIATHTIESLILLKPPPSGTVNKLCFHLKDNSKLLLMKSKSFCFGQILILKGTLYIGENVSCYGRHSSLPVKLPC